MPSDIKDGGLDEALSIVTDSSRVLRGLVPELELRLHLCRCGHGRHEGNCPPCWEGVEPFGGRCIGYIPAVGAKDMAVIASTLADLSRHMERVDKALGLGKVEVQVESGDGLVAALVAAGITLEAFKGMTTEERAKKVLEVTR